MEFEIVKTDTPDRSLLLLADESEESVADYAGRGTTYALSLIHILLVQQCLSVRRNISKSEMKAGVSSFRAMSFTW